MLLLEALHVPPQVLSQSMPTLEHVDVLFTSVDAFKGWVLKNLERKEVRQEPAAFELPEPRKRSQAQLTGLLRARGTQPRSEAAPVSEETNEKGMT